MEKKIMQRATEEHWHDFKMKYDFLSFQWRQSANCEAKRKKKDVSEDILYSRSRFLGSFPLLFQTRFLFINLNFGLIKKMKTKYKIHIKKERKLRACVEHVRLLLKCKKSSFNFQVKCVYFDIKKTAEAKKNDFSRQSTLLLFSANPFKHFF